MKRILLSAVTFLIITLFFSTCYYDSEEALYPELSTSCDTTNVTFSGTIVPILSNNCYSCHSNKNAASSGNNIRLEDHADVKARNVAVSGSMKHSPAYVAMPKNGGKVKDCYITEFDIWVRKGMPNN
jgi:hypothetical protein